MRGNRETWKQAFRLIEKHMIDSENKLVTSELVDWHNEAVGDDGLRTWWTSIALYQLAFNNASLHSDTNRLMYSVNHILEYRGDLKRAVAAVSKLSDGRSVDQGVYLKEIGRNTVWSGPFRATPSVTAEWPDQIYNCIQYRGEYEFAYDSTAVDIYWFPHALLSSINQLLIEVKPVGISLNDVDESSRLAIQNGITAFAEGDTPHIWEVIQW